MARRTHKMISANSSVTDNGRMTQANSISAPCVRNYISCEESGGTINTLADVKNAATILDKTTAENVAAIVSLEEGDTAGVNVRFEAWSDATNVPKTEFNFDSPAGKDFLILAIGKARNDPAGEENEGGAIAFYCGGADIDNYSQVKVHPYYSVFIPATGSGAAQFPTATYRAGLKRTDGQTYAVCAVKRGGMFEHWVDGEKVGERNMAEVLAQQDSFNAAHPLNGGPTNQEARWNNIQFDDLLGAGHGAYGDSPWEAFQRGHVDFTYPEHQVGVNPTDLDHWERPSEGTWNAELSSTECGNYRWSGTPLFAWVPSNVFYAQPEASPGVKEYTQGSWPEAGDNEGVANYPQDYYGFLVVIFENGMPDDVGEAMDWMKTEWMAGNKVTWPDWVSLE